MRNISRFIRHKKDECWMLNPEASAIWKDQFPKRRLISVGSLPAASDLGFRFKWHGLPVSQTPEDLPPAT